MEILKNKKWLYWVIFFLIFFSFFPVFQAGFVNWDDPEYAFAEPSVRAFDIGAFFTRLYANHYSPLTMITLALDHAFWGAHAFGFHLTNWIFHFLNCILVFLVLDRLFPNRIFTRLAAILFAVHPLHVESVAWVSERKDVLSTLFYLLSIQAYISHVHQIPMRKHSSQTYRNWGLSLAFFVGALLSKPMAITLPAILLLIDWLHPERSAKRGFRKLALEKAPFIALSASFTLIPMIAHRSAELIRSDRGALSPLLDFGSSYVFYALKALLPLDLTAHYYRGHFHLGAPGTVAGGAVLLSLIIAAMHLKTVSKPILFGLLFYFLTLLPVSGIVPFSETQQYAERYFYIPSIGFFLALCAACTGAHERWCPRLPFAALFWAAVLALGASTFMRSGIWRNSETLWMDVLEKDPRNEIALSNLASVYLEKRNFEKTKSFAKQALQENPKNALTWLLLGFTARAEGNRLQAVQYLDQAHALSPKLPEAVCMKCDLLRELGQSAELPLCMKKCEELSLRSGSSLNQ